MIPLRLFRLPPSPPLLRANSGTGAGLLPVTDRKPWLRQDSEKGATAMTTTADIITIALGKLDRDPKNVRKSYCKEGIEELAANIRADGYRLLQNIVVRKGDKKGRYFVTAGERRRLALCLLAEAGEINGDFPVEAKLREETDAISISLAENTMREDMHPVDQYEAFRIMADDGKPIADIAARYGSTETVVRKRLALARVSPALLGLHRNEEITYDQLTAFTLSDDHRRQEEVWNALPSWNRTGHAIRNALRDEAIAATDKRIRFIGGLDTYEGQGGVVRRDLFDERSQGHAMDVALVERLVAKKMETLASSVHAEGWAWVEVRTEMDWHGMRGYGRVFPVEAERSDAETKELETLRQEQEDIESLIEDEGGDESTEARLAEIASRISEIDREVYAASDLERAGVLITLDYTGEPAFHRGYLKPESAQVPLNGKAEPDNQDGGEPGTVADGPTAPVLTHSVTLVEDLTAQRTAALRLEIANNHRVALASVVHSLLLQTLLPHSRYHSCLDVVLTTRNLPALMKAPENNLALAGIEELRERYGYEVPGNPADMFEWCLDRREDELLALLAYAAAQSIDAVKDKYDHRKHERVHSEALAVAVGLDIGAYFEPTAESYFNHITRDGIEAAVSEAKGTDAARGIARMKKGEAAAYAEAQVKGTGWLPSPIRPASVVAQVNVVEADAIGLNNVLFEAAE
ncbi:ParB/RepB/Spo0J family partition protein [Ensifer adhaerens]|uniref:ParB/RepB/Spo0J family partition protein n=2 Tax=Ensifer adhaerens TaxID=106592 RepID=UPI00351F4194